VTKIFFFKKKNTFMFTPNKKKKIRLYMFNEKVKKTRVNLFIFI
jgi:hypothetical protein